MTVFIPFGKHCGPATILRDCGLRRESLPFDWLFALPEYIKDSLDTDFAKWFDPDNLVHFKHPTWGNSMTECISYPIDYESEDTLVFFNHHNLTDPEVQKTFKKRIQRFKDIIASDEKIVFLTTASQDELSKNGLLDYFDRKAKTDFVFLEHSYSTKNKVVSSVQGDYLTIKYRCESHLSNPPISLAIRDRLKHLS